MAGIFNSAIFNNAVFNVGSVIPPVGVIPPGGAGHPVYWQGKRKRRKLIDQPERHLRWILEKVVAEYYADIIASDVPQSVKREAAALVKPYAEIDKGIPPVAVIDWDAVQRNADAVGTILQIWHEEVQRDIDADDEEILILH